jgi:hypothetical protein
MHVVPFGRLIETCTRSAHAMVIGDRPLARVFRRGLSPAARVQLGDGRAAAGADVLLGFTGYLLPGSQLSYWAVTVGHLHGRGDGDRAPGPFALAGEDADVRALLLGDRVVGDAGLLRFYVLHCVVVPAAMVALMAMHFFRVRRDGGVLAKY